jgi:small subunit ribosomal protein S20
MLGLENVSGQEVDSLPNIKSAKKRVLVIKSKTLRNQMLKSALKTTLKKFDSAILSGDAAQIGDVYKSAVKRLDQSVSKGILHKNTASRKKAQLTRKFNQVSA